MLDRLPPLVPLPLPEPDRRALRHRAVATVRSAVRHLSGVVVRRVLRRPRPSQAVARSLRLTFETLGATYVKLGQLVASSPGVFGDAVANAPAGAAPVACRRLRARRRRLELRPRHLPAREAAHVLRALREALHGRRVAALGPRVPERAPGAGRRLTGSGSTPTGASPPPRSPPAPRPAARPPPPWRAAPRRWRPSRARGSRPHPRHLHHAPYPAEAPHDAVQLVEAAHHELEGVLRLAIAEGVHLGAGDVDAGRADRLRHGGEETRAIDARHLHLDRPRRLLPVHPMHVDPPLGLALQHFGALERMHGDAAPARDEARDALARQRAAALPEADEHVLDARHLHAALRLPPDQAQEPLQPALALLAAPLDLFGRQDAREHALRGHLPVADAGEQRLLVALRELLRHALERAVLAEPGRVELMAGEVAFEDLAPDGDQIGRASCR